jgi:hypothetical protein
MKNKTKLFGIIAFVAVMGLAITACDNAGDDLDELDKLYRDNTVTITGTAKVGQKLTATSSGNGFKPGSKFFWTYADSKDANSWSGISGYNYSGTDNSVLTIPDDSYLLGKYIRASLALNYNDPEHQYVKGSNAIGPVTK